MAEVKAGEQSDLGVARAAIRAWSRILLWLVVLHISAGFAAASAMAGDLPPVPEGARGEGAIQRGDSRVRGRLLIDPPRSEAAAFRVGVLFDLDPGWHMYWRNPGDTGLPTRLSWAIDGGSVGEVQWPAPMAFREADGMFTTFGYEKRVLLFSEAAYDADWTGERYARVSVELLVCKTQCVPASFELERSISSISPDSRGTASERAVFDEFAAQVPVSPESIGLDVSVLYSRSAIAPGEDFEGALLIRSCARAALDGDCEKHLVAAGDDQADALHGSRDGFIVDLPDEFTFEAGSATPPDPSGAQLLDFEGNRIDGAEIEDVRLRGVLNLVGENGGPVAVELDLPMPLAMAGEPTEELGRHWASAAAKSQAAAPPAPEQGLLGALALALLGGLILNLMPCVLPVLAIKVFSVAEMAGRSRREVLTSGAAYAAGILLSMAVLAGVVLALRAAGTQVGWGFQFQSPIFVAVISTVLVTFALNLFGVFEISVDVSAAAEIGNEAVGARRSFFEGLLAVVLATPCSAPFLGTAVGFAFASPATHIVAIFLAIGAGLAAPFVLVTLIPAWSGLIPRSGPWMLKLRAGLGFALLATQIWLFSIIGGLSGLQGVVLLSSLLLALAFGLWIFGNLQGRPSGRYTAAGVAILTIAALVQLDGVLGEARPASASAALAVSGPWEPWSEKATREALATGKPVFVAFSADWCITCKVNEELVLSDERILQAFEEGGWILLYGDWTARDEAIRQELSRHGRAGVPVYLLYGEGEQGAPSVLPELLTVDGLLEMLGRASGRMVAQGPS